LSSEEVKGKHYENLKLQPREYIAKNNLNFFIGNAVKYVSRYPYKNGIQDLAKAIDNINFEIKRVIEAEAQHIHDAIYLNGMDEAVFKDKIDKLIRDATTYLTPQDRTDLFVGDTPLHWLWKARQKPTCDLIKDLRGEENV